MNFIINWIIRNGASLLFIGILTILVGSLLYKGIDTIKGKLGFDTVSSVKKELNTAKANTETAITTTKELNDELDKQDRTNKIVLDTVTVTADKEKETLNELLDLLKKKDEKINKLMKLYEEQKVQPKPKPIMNDVIKLDKKIAKLKTKVEIPKVKLIKKKNLEKKVSEIQITAIWNKFQQVNNRVTA